MTSKGRIGKVIEVRRSAQELSLEWRIINFLSLRCECYDWYESPRFSFWDGCWNLRVWPNWNSERVCPGLYRENSGTSVKTVTVAFGVKGSNGVEKRTERVWEFSNDGDQCLSFFCSRSELSEQKQRLMPNDVLTITCEMTPALDSNDRGATNETDDDLKEPITNGKQAPGKKGVEELSKSLHGLLAGEEDSDVRISVGAKEFPAHRAILRARSPVFHAMFAHDTVEKQSGVVTMEDCDPETFPDFLEHVYTGNVEMISDSNVFDLYQISDKYDLNTLKTECTEFLNQNLTIDSFCNTITLAIRHDDEDLTARATEFFCDNSLEIAETAEWQTFVQENPTFGNELFTKALRHNHNIFLTSTS